MFSTWSKTKVINLTFYSIDTRFDSPTVDSFLKTLWGKREIARNKQFLLFPQCFLLNQIIVSLFVHIFVIISLFPAKWEDPKIGIWGKGSSTLIMSSANALNLDQSKILSFGKELTKFPYQTVLDFHKPWKKKAIWKHCGKRRKCW